MGVLHKPQKTAAWTVLLMEETGSVSLLDYPVLPSGSDWTNLKVPHPSAEKQMKTLFFSHIEKY
jgi:hypothetical protein